MPTFGHVAIFSSINKFKDGKKKKFATAAQSYLTKQISNIIFLSGINSRQGDASIKGNAVILSL